jgi:soluble lytic murein transglycosylase
MTMLEKRTIVALSSLVSLALMLAIVGMTSPQISQESIRPLVQEGSYDLALRLLSREGAPTDFYTHQFQRAFCLQELERWDEAAPLYEDLLGIPSPMKDYLHLFLSICYARSGRYEEAETQLIELLEVEQSLLVNEGQQLLAHLYLELGRAEEALQVLELLASSPTSEDQLSEFWFSMGQAHKQAGRMEDAALLFGQILDRHPASPAALKASEELKAIRGGALAGEELFDLAWVSFHHRRYGEATQEWTRFVEYYPHHQRAPEALYLSARAQYRGQQYRQAEAICRRLLQVYSQSRWVTSAHYLLARCAEADGEITLAELSYQRFVRDYPWSQLADDALWQVAKLHERRGDLSAAQREYLVLSRQYASRLRAVEALWRAGLCAFWSEDDAATLAIFNRLRERYPQSHWFVGSLYWSARAHLRAGDRAMADWLYDQIVQLDSEGYYACLATGRLRHDDFPLVLQKSPGLETKLDAEQGVQFDLEPAIARHYERGKALLRLGLLPCGRFELSRVLPIAHKHSQVLVDLLRLYQEYQLYGDALRLAQEVSKQVEGPQWSENLELLLYPLGHMETVIAEAEKYGLEPYLILSVVRVESHFDPLAVSPAGARGLMQIMPSTGKEIEEQLGLSSHQEVNPFQPQWSIRLGSYYLWRQLEEFSWRTEMALAAYNAGPGNVRRWLRRLGAVDPELFVELIDFAETRGFIKKVLTTQAHYRRIWSAPG